MAAPANNAYLISIYNETLRFGIHTLPFPVTVFAIQKDENGFDEVRTHLIISNNQSIYYDIKPLTIEKTSELTQEIFINTKALYNSNILRINPQFTDRITLSMTLYPEKAATVFRKYVAPLFFRETHFQIDQNQSQVQISDKQGGERAAQVNQMKSALQNLENRTFGNLVFSALQQNNDPEFFIEKATPNELNTTSNGEEAPLDLPDGYIVSPNHVLVVREGQSTRLDNTNEIQALFRSSKVEKPDGKEPASK